MIAASAELASRALRWQLLVSASTIALIGVLGPRLLLLRGPVEAQATGALVLALSLGFVASWASAWLRLRRHRFVLRALTLGSRSVEPFEMEDLSELPWRLTLGWLTTGAVGLLLVLAFRRPAALDLPTGLSVALLAVVMLAAAALPLNVALRSVVAPALELAPPEVMREVMESEEPSGRPALRLPRRLLFAVATPVAFLAIGAALIVAAHLRRADERHREETARALARAVLEPVPGVVPDAGLERAESSLEAEGFAVQVDERTATYGVELASDGAAVLSTPLDDGSARVRFAASTVSVLSAQSSLIVLLAVAAAALLGETLGRALGRDLREATRAVRLLGTEAVLDGQPLGVPEARFKVVAELDRAIESLAERFRTFARAQERAIDAREAATRMRGLFFASVSHDLKSPLNAILGFTELVAETEPLSAGQSESIDLIARRGRELLALIETILDAARVEASQLALYRERCVARELVEAAMEKGRDLGGDSRLEVVMRVAEDTPDVVVDRVRFARVLATYIGHALRSARRDVVTISAERAPSRTPGSTNVVARFTVEVPTRSFSAQQLEALLDPARQPGSGAHRGLSLGLGLSRAIVSQHGGSVHVADRGSVGTAFVVELPAADQSVPRSKS